MPKNDSLRSSVHSLLESFASQIEAVVRESTLENIKNALGGLDAAPRRRGRPKGSGRPGRKPGGGGRAGSARIEQMSERLLVYVKKNPGQRGEQIAKAMRSDVKTIRLPMKKLIAAKQVKTKGQRRGMTYAAA